MNSPHIIPFRPEHLTMLSMRSPDYEFYRNLREFYTPIVADMVRGISYSAVVDDTLLGCAGLQAYWPGNSEAWIIVGPDATKYKLWIIKTLIPMLDNIQQGHRITRIQLAALKGSSTEKLAGILGFKEEGEMKAYGPNGEDFVRYARIRRCQPPQ